MRIGLVDVDGHNFPNIALMKLSAWHKRRGDTVEFADPAVRRYDKVYMSKVFTFSRDCTAHYDCEVVRAVLLDNNVLASEWGLMQIEKIVRMGIRVDFNQGLDARRIARTPEIAALLARVKWIRFLRMAYDSRAMQDDVHKAIELLRKHGVPARKLFLYVLIRDDTEDALGRIRELKALGCQPFAQPYRDFEHEGKPSREQWRLAYWCNRKPLFYSVDYEEYRKNRT